MDKQEKKDKHQSLKEVGNIFSEIDKRIISLYKCSSDDFVTFNTQLKKFHNQINVVSSNATEVLNLSGGNGTHDFIGSLNSLVQDIEQHLNATIASTDKNAMNFERLLKNINSMMLYSRNYKQNLLTYKYLITNLKLSVAYLDSENSTMNEDIDNIVKYIAKANSELPSLDSKLNHAKIAITELVSGLKRFIKINSDDFANLTRHLETTKNNTMRHTQDLHSYIEKLNEKIDACSENVGQIITHLQFQDIIRQKMEHIQEMHKEVLDIIGSFEDTQINQLSGIKQARYLVQIRDVAELQVAQLSHTNRQYQKAIELISKMFLVIIENITDASLLNVMFPGQSRKHAEHFDKAIETALTHILDRLTHVETEMIKSKNSIEKIFGSFRDINETIDSLKSHHDELIKQSMVIVDSIQRIGLGKYDQKNILDHLNGLLISNKNLSLIHLLNNQNNKLLQQMQQKPNRTDTNGFHHDIKHFQKTAHDIIQAASLTSQKIQEIIQENDVNTSALIDEIFTSMQEVKYYDYFEKVIEEIILQLNQIYMQLAFNKKNKKRNVKNSAIQHFKDFYTMESERQIHTDVFAKEGLLEIGIQDEIDDDQNKGDLELF